MRGLVASPALDWIVSNLSRFNPFLRGPLPDERSQTALAELALLYYHLRRRAGFAQDPRLHQCLDLIEQVYRQPLFHEYAFRGDRGAFGGHLLIWLTLADRNIEAVVSREQFQWMIDSGNVLAVEREPYRALERRYFLELGGFEHRLPSEADLFHQTFLGRDFEIPAMMISDIYSITHTIFYLTDYGARTSPLLNGPSHKERILELLRVLLGMMIHARHWDLVGELILSYRCLERVEEPVLEVGWKVLRANQDSSGLIRHSPSMLPQLEELPAGEARDDYLFTRCHHMTLVAVMAGFLGVPDAHIGQK